MTRTQSRSKPRIDIPAYAASVFFIVATMAASAAPIEAKEYNKSKGIPADSQALVNRIQAQMSSTNGEGEFSSTESNCDELNVGANTEESRPDQQVIIADKIINVGGQCRMIRNQGGFKPKEGDSSANAKPAAKKQ